VICKTLLKNTLKMKTHPIVSIFAIVAIASVSVIFLFSGKPAETDKLASEYAVLRLYENASDISSQVLVSYGDGKHESVQLWGYRDMDQDLKENSDTLIYFLNKLESQGFRLVTSSSAGKLNTNNDMMVTTMIFQRRH